MIIHLRLKTMCDNLQKAYKEEFISCSQKAEEVKDQD